MPLAVALLIGKLIALSWDTKPCTAQTDFISTDAQILDYAGCTSLDYLWLGCEPGKSLSNITALQNLQRLNSRHPQHGISLGVYNCDGLLDLSALSNLSGSLAGGLVVYDNAKLKSLAGLKNIKGIMGNTSQGVSLWIGYNDALHDISALSNIRGVPPGRLSVHHNPKLASISALEEVKQWGGGIKAEIHVNGSRVTCTTWKCAFGQADNSAIGNSSMPKNSASGSQAASSPFCWCVMICLFVLMAAGSWP